MSCIEEFPSGECSENGMCIISNITLRAMCICEDDFSGYGDFTSRVDQDCQTGTIVMDAFVIMALICRIAMLLITSYKFFQGLYHIAKHDGSIWDAVITYPGRWYLLVMAESTIIIIMSSLRIQDRHENLIGYSTLGNIGFTIWLECWSWLVFDVTISQIRLAVAIIRFDAHRSERVDRVIGKLQPAYIASQAVSTITQATPLLYFIHWNDDDHRIITILVAVAWLLCMASHVCTFLFIVARILEVLDATDIPNVAAKRAAAMHPSAVAPAPVAAALPPPSQQQPEHAGIAMETPLSARVEVAAEPVVVSAAAVKPSLCTTCWRACVANAAEQKARHQPRDSRYGEAIHRLQISHRTLGRALVVAIFLIVATAWPYLLTRLNLIWWFSVTMPFQGILAGFFAIVRWPHSVSRAVSSASAPVGAAAHMVPNSPDHNQHHNGSLGSGSHGSPMITSATRPHPPRANAFTDPATAVPTTGAHSPLLHAHTAVISVTTTNTNGDTALTIPTTNDTGTKTAATT